MTWVHLYELNCTLCYILCWVKWLLLKVRIHLFVIIFRKFCPHISEMVLLRRYLSKPRCCEQCSPWPYSIFRIIMVLLDQLFCDNFLSKSLFGIQIVKDSYQRMQMIYILLKYILWYEFLNDLDVQSDCNKNIVTKTR